MNFRKYLIKFSLIFLVLISLNKKSSAIEPDQFIQVASLVLSKNQSFIPHKHIWKDVATNRVIAQESWVVISGKIKVDYYDLDDKFLDDFILSQGDCTCLLYTSDAADE